MFKRFALLGCLGTLVPVLAVVAALLFAGDVAARRYATGQLSDRVSASAPEASGVHARIRSFPFIGKILLNGSVGEVGVHINQIKGSHGIVFSDLDVDLRGVVLDGDAAFTDHTVKLKRIRRGTVTMSLTEQAVSDALGRTARISGGQVFVTTLGRTVAGTVRIAADRNIDLSVASLPVFAVPLPSARLLPCLPTLAFVEGRVDLSCTFTRVPDAFVQAAPTVAS